jgi:ComF family protein
VRRQFRGQNWGVQWPRVTNALQRLENRLLPNRCVFCGTDRPPATRAICGRCYAELPWASSNRMPSVLPMYAPLIYSYPVDVAIKAMKFRRKLHYVSAFAAILLETTRALPADIDALLPVPLHWRRQALRGFNQAEELCRPLQRHTGVPLIRNVLRHRATPSQSGLGAVQRQRNLRGAFTVRGRIGARHVLLVDDVITTGATCTQLAELLLDAGAEQVSVVAIARA